MERNFSVEQFLKFQVSCLSVSQAAGIEVLLEVPELESSESLDPNAVYLQQLSSEEYYASRNGTIGSFGILVLASSDLREQTSIFFRLYNASNEYIGLMCIG
ncbi:putative fructan beta-(2,6)-fructosidase [Lupinus albus]|uniref:Putative fructan beta-(2,6)-fructosidase n=1 Tax=Lupinus albus TaxID=3870 RepID=A0A6A4Q5W0_LUPAL|nr:putative fructan beta-(2,6)-fructosidase [Lupinus albus]